MWAIVEEYFHEIARPFESCRLKAYWDPVGYPTQGWGRLMSRTRFKDKFEAFIADGASNREALDMANAWLQSTFPPIDQETADRWLHEDGLKAFRSAQRQTIVRLTPSQWAAVTDFCFNAGGGNYQISTFKRMINRGDIEDAAEEILKWNKAGGKVLPGLIRRAKKRREYLLR